MTLRCDKWQRCNRLCETFNKQPKLTEKISTMSFVVVRTGSTSFSDNTLISDVPSVSRIHSWIALNSPSSVMTILFLSSVVGKCMYTWIKRQRCRCKKPVFAAMHYQFQWPKFTYLQHPDIYSGAVNHNIRFWCTNLTLQSASIIKIHTFIFSVM